MAGRRLPIHRIAGIAAWTAASVTWGTAAVALANHEPAVEPAEASTDPVATPVVIQADSLPSIPAMPESGLIVLRYTPSEQPQPEVVVRTVSVAGGSQSTRQAPVKEKSSGS